MSAPLSQYWLEKLAAGELTAEEQQRLREQHGAALDAALESLHRSNQEVLRRYPSFRVEGRAPRGAGRPAPAWVLVPVAAVCALVLLVRPSLLVGSSEVREDREITRTKGTIGPKLLVHRQRDGGAELLGDGAAARADDLLQLSYEAAGAAYGAVFSVDGRGQLTLHYPERADGSTALRRDGVQPLPRSYQLDDAPAFERFVFVTSPQPIQLDSILEAAKAVGSSQSLPLPPSFEQFSLTLNKVEP